LRDSAKRPVHEEKCEKKKELRKRAKKKTARNNRLEEATASYFASLSPEALEEENRLGAALSEAASPVNFDE
jgi:hypothetical protein